MKQTILVPGTHAWRDNGKVEWYCKGSAYERFISSRGAHVVFGPNGEPWLWDTEVGGIGFGDEDLLGWKAAGLHLFQTAVPWLCQGSRIPGDELCLVLHSHGGNVGFFACAAGLKVDTFITVGTPVRKDMEDVVRQARPNIRRWLHLYSDKSDRMQWLGELFDGRWGVVRKFPQADRNEFMPEGHSMVLNKLELLPLWEKNNWLEGLING